MSTKKLTAMQEVITDLDMINEELNKADDDASKVMSLAVKRIQKHIIESGFIKKEQDQIQGSYLEGAVVSGASVSESLEAMKMYYSKTYITEADKPRKIN